MPTVLRRPPPARLTQLARLAFPPGRSFVEHSHDDEHELSVIVSGAMETRLEGALHPGGAGTALLHPRRVAHAERAVGAKPCEMLYVAWRGAPADRAPGWPRAVADPTGRMRALMEWMLALDPAVPSQLAARDALFQALLAVFVAAPARPIDGLVLAVRERVAGRLDEPIRLADLAAHAKLSKYHFVRVFSAATGLTPMAYVRRMRIEAARSLLLVSDLPLRAIAAQVGFADEFILSRAVRRHTGQPPRALRAAARGRRPVDDRRA